MYRIVWRENLLPPGDKFLRDLRFSSREYAHGYCDGLNDSLKNLGAIYDIQPVIAEE